jgi:peptidoglycan hydrolase-like protein with peptidoglycan-binding domain
LLKILSGALFCKGYRGFYPGETPIFTILEPALTAVMERLGIAARGTGVDVKLMKSLLSMDAYQPVWGGSGRGEIVAVQRWLNGKYIHRRDFNLIPTDGVYSRQTLDGMLYAVQYEIGMADGVANGNFGPGTKTGLKSLAYVQEGSSDTSRNFVRLFQACLITNRVDVPLSGVFDLMTQTKVFEFQSFLELAQTGAGDYSTWCALLVSNGDDTVATKGMDTNVQLTLAQSTALRTAGYTHVGRYLTGPNKFITIGEIKNLQSAGLSLFPLFQVYNNELALLTYSEGKAQGLTALQRAYILGLPDQSTVYFAVDFDPTEQGIRANVMDFFRGVNASVASAHRYKLRVGVYGTRNVCQILIDEGLATGAFVAGASYKFSGNMGFPMPSQWHYNQISTDLPLPNGSPDQKLDKVVVSRNAHSINATSVIPPPPHREQNLTSELGFDLVHSWIAKLELRAEQIIVLSSVPFVDEALPKVLQLDSALLHVLRLNKYWTDGWKAYTPILGKPAEWHLALLGAEDALDEFPRFEHDYDISHFAASLLGYETWSPVYFEDPAKLSVGDLGGWIFDLLSMYSTYLASGPSESVTSYVSRTVGTAGSINFGWWDLIADADAWLTYRAPAPGGPLTHKLRLLWAKTPTQRVADFLQLRFDGSSANISSQMRVLWALLESGEIYNGMPTALALGIVGLGAVPTLAVFDELAVGFFEGMQRIVATGA